MKLSAFLARICRAVVRFVQSFARREQECFCWQRTIARYLRCSVRTVQRAMRWLVDSGELAIRRRGPHSAVYEIAKPREEAQLSLDFGGGPGGSSGGSLGVPSIYDSSESLKCVRRQIETPRVVFLRPQAGGWTEKAKKPTLSERVFAYLAEKGLI